MTTTRWVAMAAAVVLVTGVPAAPSARQTSDEARRVRDASSVFGEFMAADDRGIPRSLLSQAEGIAVFSSMVRGGFIVGGMRGRGSSAQEHTGMVAPAFSRDGAQFWTSDRRSGRGPDSVINDRRGLENLVANQFKLGADVAVAAGPVGRDAQAATDLQLRAQILSYSRSRGLFAGVTVNGSTVRQDRDANERFYGMPLETKQIVFGAGPGSHPDPTAGWLQVLDRYARRKFRGARSMSGIECESAPSLAWSTPGVDELAGHLHGNPHFNRRTAAAQAAEHAPEVARESRLVPFRRSDVSAILWSRLAQSHRHPSSQLIQRNTCAGPTARQRRS